jgi:hypothetical protein
MRHLLSIPSRAASLHSSGRSAGSFQLVQKEKKRTMSYTDSHVQDMTCVTMSCPALVS